MDSQIPWSLILFGVAAITAAVIGWKTITRSE